MKPILITDLFAQIIQLEQQVMTQAESIEALVTQIETLEKELANLKKIPYSVLERENQKI